MSSGQADGGLAGMGIGAIIGMAIAGIATAGASLAASAAFAAFSFGATLGMSVGGLAGSLLFPDKQGDQASQHDKQELQINTFSHTLPVPVLFGTARWTPNCIFIGDTYSQVEVTGSQVVGQGKARREIDIEDVIYYADFVLALGEGVFESIGRVYQEEEEITDREGDLYTLALGDGSESVNSIVAEAPNGPSVQVPWRNTAKLYFSGRLGPVNRIPRIIVEADGPATTVERSGVLTGMPATVSQFYHDDLSDRLTLVTGDQTIVTCGREGEAKRTTTVPDIGVAIELAIYDGRTGSVLALSALDATNNRYIFVGEEGYGASDDWQYLLSEVPAMQYGIDAWVFDDASGKLWTAHLPTSLSVVLVSTDVNTGAQEVYTPQVPGTGFTIRALYYWKSPAWFYLLYTAGSDLMVFRFSITDSNDWDTMQVGYGHNDPIGLAKVGDLFCVFDRAASQPLHYFQWGNRTDELAVGSQDDAVAFNPRHLGGSLLYFDALSADEYGDGNPVSFWDNTEPSTNTVNLQQGTTADRPTYRQLVSEFRSLPALEFDGSSDRLDLTYVPAGGSQSPQLIDRSAGVTWTFVIRPLGPGTTQSVFWSQNRLYTGSNLRIDFGWGGVGAKESAIWIEQPQNASGTGFSNPLGSNTIPLASGEAAVIIIRLEGGTFTVQKNGSETSSGAAFNGTGTDDTFRAGGRVPGSAYALAVPNYAYVQIAEIAVHSRALSDQEVEQVFDYTRTKYRIAYQQQYNEYLTPGDKLIFGDAQEFLYSPGLSQLMVRDRTTGGAWALYFFHYNGDNWSYLRETAYFHVLFSETSSCSGAVYSLITNERYGAGVNSSFVDRYTFERASGFCNEPTDARFYTFDDTSFDARFQLDYLLSSKRALSSVLNEMLACFNAFLIYSEGVLKLHAQRDLGYVDGHYDGSSILEGSFNFQEMGREERQNVVEYEVFDKRDDYRRVPVRATAEWEKDIYGEVRKFTMVANGVSRLRQAGTLAWTMLLSLTTKRFACAFATAANGLKQEVSDVISVTRPEIGWDKKLFQILAIAESENEEISLTCVEYVPGVAENDGFPLQDPDRPVALEYGNAGGQGGANSNFVPVTQAARIRVIENTQTGEAWLMASRPSGSGPWSKLRWHFEWDQTTTSGSVFYPGNVPLLPNVYTLVKNTSYFTVSGLLAASITDTGLSLQLHCLLGEAPTDNVDLIIYNEQITSTQFGNSNGNGKYERVEVDSYDSGTSTATLSARGISTNALAHSVSSVPVAAAYVSELIQAPSSASSSTPNTPSVALVYLANGMSVAPSAGGPRPLHGARREEVHYYIGFDPSDWTASTPNGVNVLEFEITQAPGIFAAIPTVEPLVCTFWYSSGPGEWTEMVIGADETEQFTKSGKLSFDPPADWVASDRFAVDSPAVGGGTTSYQFPDGAGATPGVAGSRYYLRVTRSIPPIEAGPYAGQRVITQGVALTNQGNNSAAGSHSPTVYFLRPNAQPTYDFISAEQGYRLNVKVQPVGVRNQSIILDDLDVITYDILNLANE